MNGRNLLGCVVTLAVAALLPGARNYAAVAAAHAGKPAVATRSAKPVFATLNRTPRLTVARLQYDGGGDWYANPSSIPNLLAAIASRTSLKVEKTEARVRLTDDALWDYPFLYVTGHGNIRFTEAEVDRLREYLLKGGFLHVDDNYGLDESFRREIRRVFPDRALVDVPLSHPVYNIVYAFPAGIPKIHEHDGKPARGYGVFIGDRLALYYSYESDLGDGWEDPSVHGDPPDLHEKALRMGVNLFAYAITSRPE